MGRTRFDVDFSIGVVGEADAELVVDLPLELRSARPRTPTMSLRRVTSARTSAAVSARSVSLRPSWRSRDRRSLSTGFRERFACAVDVLVVEEPARARCRGRG